jgi:plasmid maintenance system antidote protein VapI
VVALDAKVIQHENARRGWNNQDLARYSKLSRPTISVAVRGGLVTARTAQRIRAAYDRNKPTLDGLVRESA